MAGSDEIQAFDEVQENGEAAGTESAEAEGQLSRLNIIPQQMAL